MKMIFGKTQARRDAEKRARLEYCRQDAEFTYKLLRALPDPRPVGYLRLWYWVIGRRWAQR